MIEKQNIVRIIMKLSEKDIKVDTSEYLASLTISPLDHPHDNLSK